MARRKSLADLRNQFNRIADNSPKNRMNDGICKRDKVLECI